jgi:hypothetical protein
MSGSALVWKPVGTSSAGQQCPSARACRRATVQRAGGYLAAAPRDGVPRPPRPSIRRPQDRVAPGYRRTPSGTTATPSPTVRARQAPQATVPPTSYAGLWQPSTPQSATSAYGGPSATVQPATRAAPPAQPGSMGVAGPTGVAPVARSDPRSDLRPSSRPLPPAATPVPPTQSVAPQANTMARPQTRPQGAAGAGTASAGAGA